MMFDDLTTRILYAVMTGSTTGTVIAERVGTDRFTVHRLLCLLRDAKLVTWDDNRVGTIRALVEEIPR